MNFPNRLELLLWAVLAFPKACEENRKCSGDEDAFLQASGWALRTPVCWTSLSGPGDREQSCAVQVRSNVLTRYLYVRVVGETEVLSVIKNDNHGILSQS